MAPGTPQSAGRAGLGSFGPEPLHKAQNARGLQRSRVRTSADTRQRLSGGEVLSTSTIRCNWTCKAGGSGDRNRPEAHAAPGGTIEKDPPVITQTSRPRRVVVATAIGALALATCAQVAVATAANAAPITPSGSTVSSGPVTLPPTTVTQVQQDIWTVESMLSALLDNPTVTAGFAGEVSNPDTGAITIYWNGAVPASVTAGLATVPSDVTVTFAPAAYSLNQLWAASSALISGNWYASLPSVNAAILDAYPAPDGSGLIVDYVAIPVNQGGNGTIPDGAAVAAAVQALDGGVAVTANLAPDNGMYTWQNGQIVPVIMAMTGGGTPKAAHHGKKTTKHTKKSHTSSHKAHTSKKSSHKAHKAHKATEK